MPKIFTLNKNGDFLALYHRGKSKAHPLLVTYVGARRRNRKKGEVDDFGVCKIGLTASKKVGNAVERNRARRIIKESFRLLLPEIDRGSGKNIVFVARQKTVDANMHQVCRAMRGQLKALGVISG